MYLITFFDNYMYLNLLVVVEVTTFVFVAFGTILSKYRVKLYGHLNKI
jgi:hypothetical protein